MNIFSKIVLIVVIQIFLLGCESNIKTDSDVIVKTISDTTKISVSEVEQISFIVDSVEVVDTYLDTTRISDVLENKLGKKIKYYPNKQDNQYAINTYNNGLIQTVQECYDNHRPLILSPDVIWLAICQGVSIHINENFKKYEDIIFYEHKPSVLKVRNDSLINGGKHWQSLIDSLSMQTQFYTKDNFYSFFVSDFSTTTEIEKTAYQITLLESYKNAFKYVGESGCGIPKITLKGNKSDWQMMIKKLELLDVLGLEVWKDNLISVLTEFINVYDGEINDEFWKGIYKDAQEYGAFYMSGWIIKFFPYIKETVQESINYEDGYIENEGGYRATEIFKENEFIDGDSYLMSTLSTDNFPSGLSMIDLEWINYFTNDTTNLEIYSGFFGMKQYSDKSLEPLIYWAICDKKSERIKRERNWTKIKELNHNVKYWSPKLIDKLTDSAIYDIKSFNSQKESLDYLKEYISENLNDNLEGTTINFIVFSSGSIGKVSLVGVNETNEKLRLKIKHLLENLPKKWFPALTYPQYILSYMFYDKIDENLKVKVNSIVKIKF